jgi:hypothetical protein
MGRNLSRQASAALDSSEEGAYEQGIKAQMKKFSKHVG